MAAFFSSDDSTAYVLSCGAECGGIKASVQQFNLNTNTLVASVPLCTSGANPQCAGSEALVNGSTMYVAGTPHARLGLHRPDNGGPILWTADHRRLIHHDRDNFRGSLLPTDITTAWRSAPTDSSSLGRATCTEIVPPVPTPPGTEIRGCLSIYNTLNTKVGSALPGGVVIPPANGDVTGIEPIGIRPVVYVVQGGSLNIYDATIDALEDNPNDPNNPGKVNALVGNFIDVKTVDF